MKIEIRPLTAQDAPAFWKLRLEALELQPRAFAEAAQEHRAASAQTAARFLKSASRDSYVLGAFDHGELVGTIGFARYDRIKTRHKGRVWGVYVTKACRGQGIGRKLLSELLQRARAQPGLEQVMLTVGDQQIAAQRLYSSLGFEVFGHERHALKVGRRYVDEYYMLCPLKRRSPRRHK